MHFMNSNLWIKTITSLLTPLKKRVEVQPGKSYFEQRKTNYSSDESSGDLLSIWLSFGKIVSLNSSGLKVTQI